MVTRVAALGEHVVHELRQQLHGDVLEGERRAVEKLEHVQSVAEVCGAAPRPHGGNRHRPRGTSRFRSASAISPPMNGWMISKATSA